MFDAASYLDEKTSALEAGWSSLSVDNPQLPDYKEAKLKMIAETLKIHSSISSSVGVSRMDFAELKRNLMEFENDSVSGGHRSKSHKSMIDFEREIEISQQSQMPAAECRLTKILGSSRRCLRELSSVKIRLAKLVDQESTKSPSDYLLMEKLGEILIIVAKEAFIPIHQLNKISLRLIECEDFIRSPKSNGFDSYSTDESIGISEACLVAQGRIRFSLDKATEYYNKFETQNAREELQIIMLTVVNALKDLLDLSNGFHKVAKALITVEKDLLEKYLQTLSSIERSDLLEEVQSLRRSIDEIAISIEKLGWAASVFHRYSRNKEFNNEGKSSTTVRESSKHLSHESSRTTTRKDESDEKVHHHRSHHSRDDSDRDSKEVSSKSSKLTRNQLERSVSVKYSDEKKKDKGLKENEKSLRNKKLKGQRLQDVAETDEEFQRNTLKREKDQSPSRNRHDRDRGADSEKEKGRGRSKSKARSEDISSDEIDPAYTRSLGGDRHRKRSKSSGATKSRGGHKEV